MGPDVKKYPMGYFQLPWILLTLNTFAYFAIFSDRSSLPRSSYPKTLSNRSL